MIAKRIIPCLDVRGGRVVKGVRFSDLKDVEDPVKMAKKYNQAGADELVFYDITASYEQRTLFTDVLKAVASQVFIPLTVGGGINELADVEQVVKCGADKVSLNSGALKNPDLINQAANRYGRQCVVLSVDVKQVHHKWHVFTKGGRVDTGRQALEWIQEGEKRGAGELVINSMDTDGVKTGFDTELLDAVSQITSLPIIASGGAGKREDFKQLFSNPKIDAGLAASIFHYDELPISELKRYLHQEHIPVRL